MVRPTPLPRVVIAAPASGQGKTTIAVGIMAALSRAGHAVAPAKVGPDYIDPGYHALATGRPGRNLDPWLTSEELIVPLLLHGARTPDPADVAVIEGVMGLFDGRIGTGGFASTAHLATLTRSPVILVADISSAARTIAATLHGLRTFDPGVDVVGVILNKAGSVRHAHEVRSSVEAIGLPVLGVLPRDAGVSAPSRHLGLIPAAERTDASTTQLISAASGEWDDELFSRLGLPRRLMPPIVSAGTRLGTLRPALARDLGIGAIDVVAQAQRDGVPDFDLIIADEAHRTTGVTLADTVGMAFAIAASTFCPLLILGVWWRRLSVAGAAAGLLVGGGLALGATLATFAGVGSSVSGWLPVLLAQPAAWTMPLAFATAVLVSLATPRSVPLNATRVMVRLHAPEEVTGRVGSHGD